MKEKIKQYIQNYYKKFGKILSYRKWKALKDTPCCAETVQNYFGNYRKACLASLGKCDTSHLNKPKQVTCLNCSRSFLKNICQIKKHSNHFCSRSCSASYNNTHKNKGTRRSKLEIYICQRLKEDFPQLEIYENRKDVIDSELDIYFPQLRLAIELNGIFHYEPIYGKDKLERTQNNDKQKIIRCYEAGIELMIIDVSQLNYFKENKANEYYRIIKNNVTSVLSRLGPP